MNNKEYLLNKQKYLAKIMYARSAVLIIAILSLVNFVIILINGNYEFFFAAKVPGLLAAWARVLCNITPFSDGSVMINPLPMAVYYIAIALALAIIAGYFVTWLLSKNKPKVPMIIALAMIMLDTVIVIGYDLYFTVDLNIFDILLRAFIVYQIIIGVKSVFDLEKISEFAPIEGESVEVDGDINGQISGGINGDINGGINDDINAHISSDADSQNTNNSGSDAKDNKDGGSDYTE